MSTMTTTTFATTLIGTPEPLMAVATAEKLCPTCGLSDDFDAVETKMRIQELEGLIQNLTARAASDAIKLADYEDEIHRLHSSQTVLQSQAIYESPRRSTSLPPTSSHTDKSTPDTVSQPSQPTYSSRLSTLANLLPYRRSSSTTSAPTTTTVVAPAPAPTALPTTPTSPPSHRDAASPTSESNAELQDALNREQELRKAAESQLSQTSSELEELTVQLFSQANEMVAQERKARAKLEERVAVLERRDIEKRTRLERLEKAMQRVERLKALVG